MSSTLILLLSFFSVFVTNDSAKILGVFPLPLISHHIVVRPLMLELAKRGHEVTVITTDPAFLKDEAPRNLTEIDVHDISYDFWKDYTSKLGSEKDQVAYLKLVFDMFLNLILIQLKSTQIQNLIQNDKKFDLIFVESCVRPALVYSHIYNAPVIEFSTLSGVFSAFESVGAATHPIIYPNPMHRKIYNLTFWDKIIEIYNHHLIERVFAQYVHAENEMFRSVIDSETFDLDDLRRNVQMLFLNVHPIWDFNRPVPPNVIYLGGLQQQPKQELPKDLKSYLDSSKNGVIYISFGTSVKPSMLPTEKLIIFNEVFSQLSYDVLWKWDNDELPGRPENVKISKWLPQPDLLRHPKVKLFITQGGLQSTVEATMAGVPLIGVPILSDQHFNVEQYLKFNIGKRLIIERLTHKELMDCIKTIINDKSYRQNVAKLGSIMRDQPLSPLERAVWWTEHVLRHGGGAHLRTPAANMHWTEYYELEMVLLLLAAFVLFLTVTVIVMYYIISYIRFHMKLKVKLN